jgi:hypothetical protein
VANTLTNKQSWFNGGKSQSRISLLSVFWNTAIHSIKHHAEIDTLNNPILPVAIYHAIEFIVIDAMNARITNIKNPF